MAIEQNLGVKEGEKWENVGEMAMCGRQKRLLKGSKW